VRTLAIRFAHHVGWLAAFDNDLVREYLATTATRLSCESIDQLLPPASLGRGYGVPDSVKTPFRDVVRRLLSRRVDMAAALVSSAQRGDPSALNGLRARWALFPASLDDIPSEPGDPSYSLDRSPTPLDRPRYKRFAVMCAQRLFLEMTLDEWASAAAPAGECRYGGAIDILTSLAQAHVARIRWTVPQALDPTSPALVRSFRDRDNGAHRWCDAFWAWVRQQHVVSLDRLKAVSHIYPGPRSWMAAARLNSHIRLATVLRWQSIDSAGPTIRTPRRTFLTMTAEKGEVYIRSGTEPFRMPTGVLLDVLSHLTREDRRLLTDIARFELWLRCQDR